MLAYANKEAMEETLELGTVHYFSRSRNCLWHKGDTSGHFQHVKEILYDCDGDTVLMKSYTRWCCLSYWQVLMFLQKSQR